MLFRSIIDVKFYLLNPCPETLWMEDVSEKKIAELRKKPYLLQLKTKGNELLINWGSVLRESYQLLLSDDNFVNSYEVIETDSFNDDSSSLLKRVQHEIYNNIPNDQRKTISNEMMYDTSLQVNGCFTPVREVEVLYNYLVDAFAKDAKQIGRAHV